MKLECFVGSMFHLTLTCCHFLVASSVFVSTEQSF